MTAPVIDHVDETGAACRRHPAASRDSLLQLAMVGSRAPMFHHDCASKLQGLMMALDELDELTANGDPQLIQALQTARDSTRELHTLLNINRALTRPAARLSIAVRELVHHAADQVRLALQGTPPDAMVDVAMAPTTHALALAFDVAAGGVRGGTLVIAGGVVGHEVELVLQAAASQPANASQALAVATFAIAREGGRLWCAAAGDRLIVRLPCP
jgi:hypothetical protein